MELERAGSVRNNAAATTSTTGLLENRTSDNAAAQRPPRTRPMGRGAFCFLVVMLTAVSFIYATYLFGVLLPDIADDRGSRASFIIAVVFHFFFLLFSCAFLKAMRTDAGGVPPHWGFYVGDEARRRRYCRVCNVWKPNRTHHCSQCGRCVLQMDHHCPWINNCVGFYNRKFFIQTLVYANVTLSIILLHSLFHIVVTAQTFWPSPDYNNVNYNEASPADFMNWGLTIILITTTSVILAGLFPFTRFHWHLLIINSTTIESMDHTFRDHDLYDLGTRRNVEQVFGPCVWLWWLPTHLSKSRPVGDGVRWRRHYARVSIENAAYDH